MPSSRRAGTFHFAKELVNLHKASGYAVGAVIDRPPLRRSARIDMVCSKLEVPTAAGSGEPALRKKRGGAPKPKLCVGRDAHIAPRRHTPFCKRVCNFLSNSRFCRGGAHRPPAPAPQRTFQHGLQQNQSASPGGCGHPPLRMVQGIVRKYDSPNKRGTPPPFARKLSRFGS